MYKVAICDDDEIFLKEFTKEVYKQLDELGMPCIVHTYKSSQSLWDAMVRDKKKYNILLLDILMDGLNGMELAHKIRAIYTHITLAFITCSKLYAIEGYDVKAFRYLVKPIAKESLKNLFRSDYYEHYCKRYIVFPQGAKYTSVSSDHVINLETAGRKTAVCLKTETFFLTCKMVDIKEILPEDIFIRCHQSYIVNLQNVIEIKRYEAKCVDGKVVPISRKYLPVVQERFLRLKNRGGKY